MDIARHLYGIDLVDGVQSGNIHIVVHVWHSYYSSTFEIMDILAWADIIGFVAILTFLWGIWNKISKVEQNMVELELRLTKEIRAVSERVATLEERTRRQTDIIPET